jgi:hypothetical protein
MDLLGGGQADLIRRTLRQRRRLSIEKDAPGLNRVRRQADPNRVYGDRLTEAAGGKIGS